MAQSLFKTSDPYLAAAEKKRQMAVFCANTELCRIVEDPVFTDPYRAARLNRWTSPELDDIALEFRADGPLKAAAQAMKPKFPCHAEALVRGDLHSGSIMATADDVCVIDPEFAFFGPIGFDVGALIGNLILAYLSQGDRDGEGRLDPEADRRRLDAVLGPLRRAVVGRGQGRCLHRRAGRRRREPGGAGRGAGPLHARPVRGHAGLCRLQDDPPHPRPR